MNGLRSILLPVTLLLATTLGAAPAPAATPAELAERFVREAEATRVELSPGAEFLALRVPQEDKTLLVVMRRSDRSIVAHLSLGEDTHVGDFEWVSQHQLVAELYQSNEGRNAPRPTGLVYTLDVRTGKGEAIAGPVTGFVSDKDVEVHAAFLLDGLRNDEENVLLLSIPIDDPLPLVEATKVDADSGTGRRVARAPVRRASLLTDPSGHVRTAVGAGSDNQMETWYRDAEGGEWRRVNAEAESGRTWWPVGFSADGSRVLVKREHDAGPDSLDWWTPATDAWATAWRDPVFDPDTILVDPDTGAAVGTEPAGGAQAAVFFDATSAFATLHGKLSRALPGMRLRIGPRRGAGLRTVFAFNDRNPGDVYLFDETKGSLEGLMAHARWIDPEAMAAKQPFRFAARDGLELHGYLTLPLDHDGGPVPMILMPHGGPIGVHDDASFDLQVQLLAAAGYGVLQVNFRGSSGRGSAFESKGLGQWGGAMQDDLSDAVAWAIAKGHAKPGGFCAVGASYGAFAAMLALARDPVNFACGLGDVGVYDLATWSEEADVGRSRSARRAVAGSLGGVDRAAVSPLAKAAAIRDPVLLTAGEVDRRTPAAQSKAFANALREADVPVTLVVYPGEGHGYVALGNRRDHAKRMLAFLKEHLPP